METRFIIGLLLLKHIYGLSDEGVCERWVHDPYFRVLHRQRVLSARLPERPKATSGDCYLKGRAGDAANVVLSAVGHNFRRILAWLRELLCLLLFPLWRMLANPALLSLAS